MQLYAAKKFDFSIVLVGRFFPLLMRPEWFARHELLPLEDAESAEVEVVVKELSRFSFSSVTVEVQEERLVIRTSEETLAYLIADLAIGVIANVPETEVNAVGMNVAIDFECNDTKFWHFVGDTLAPKDIWNEAVPNAVRVGLKNLQLQVSMPSAARSDSAVLHLQNYSVSWLKLKDWLQFSMNNHFGLKEEFASSDFDAVSIIREGFQDSVYALTSISEKVLGTIAEAYQK